MTIFAAADTIAGDIGLLPPGLDAYMSYVDNFGGFSELARRFGPSGAFLVSITIFGNRARCADMESGAMKIANFPHWYDHVAIKDEFGPPWGYTSASNMAELIRVAAGRPFIRWSAHYGAGPHICGPHTCGFPQADWTQWDDKGAHGENIDRSIGTWLPSLIPAPTPTPPEDAMAISSTLNHNGKLQVFVEKQDGSVVHTGQDKPDGDFWRNPDGSVKWLPLGKP